MKQACFSPRFLLILPTFSRYLFLRQTDLADNYFEYGRKLMASSILKCTLMVAALLSTSSAVYANSDPTESFTIRNCSDGLLDIRSYDKDDVARVVAVEHEVFRHGEKHTFKCKTDNDKCWIKVQRPLSTYDFEALVDADPRTVTAYHTSNGPTSYAGDYGSDCRR